MTLNGLITADACCLCGMGTSFSFDNRLLYLYLSPVLYSCFMLSGR